MPMTKTGSALASFGPLLVIGLKLAGVGDCPEVPADVVDAAAAACVNAADTANSILVGLGALVTGIGSVVAWLGRNRAERRHAAEIAAAKG